MVDCCLLTSRGEVVGVKLNKVGNELGMKDELDVVVSVLCG